MKLFKVALAALVTCATPVFSQSLQVQPINPSLRLTGPVTTTGVSGVSSTATVTIGQPSSPRAALYGAQFGERGDAPCFVRVFKEVIDDPDIDRTPAAFDMCPNGGPTNRSLRTASYHDNSPDGTDVFVTAVQVCMNSGSDRIKGVRLYGAKVMPNGDVVDLPDFQGYIEDNGPFGESHDYTLNGLPYVQFWRNNCNSRWQTVERCPDGHVATALVAHTGPGQTRRNVRGLALACREVTNPLAALQGAAFPRN